MKTAAFSRNIGLRRAFAALALFLGLLARLADARGAPVTVMDPKAGMPIFTIDLPPGWTYSFDSIWDRRANPYVNFSFSAQSPDGIERYTILPAQAIQTAMPPLQFARSFIERLQKSEPRFAALNYRIVEAEDRPVPPQTQAQLAQKNVKMAAASIRGEYTENGVAKTELMLVRIMYAAANSNMVIMEAISGRRGNENALTQKMVAISTSRRNNPQWEQRQAAMNQQYLAENTREMQAGLANQQRQWDQVKAQQQAQDKVFRQQMDARMQQQDAQRAAIRQQAERRMESSARVNQGAIDAIKNENVYRDSSGGTFRDTDKYKYIYTNPTNDKR
ncbi:MAG: hypothetical protein LBS70_03505, partial [Candidatus Accumulibacter sp.]|nr:hypothetical protein [Accumulibacter sp.]